MYLSLSFDSIGVVILSLEGLETEQQNLSVRHPRRQPIGLNYLLERANMLHDNGGDLYHL
jgi:hypothetical protein